MVRVNERKRERIEDLSNLRFLNASGKWIPFSNTAQIEPGHGAAQVTRYDNRRCVTVFADVETDTITSLEVNQLLQKRFTVPDAHGKPLWTQMADLLLGEIRTGVPIKGYSGYTLTFGGENEETQRSLSSLMRAFALSFLLIYFIMASVFRSYAQPLVVLTTIPFSFIGVVVGLYCMGEPIGIMALIGIISLNGIVVNDAIVLVDFINNARMRGVGRWRSVYESGVLRIRPIILTSVTTIGGLLPLMIWASGSSEFLKPMGHRDFMGIGFRDLLNTPRASLRLQCFGRYQNFLQY